MQHKNVPDDVLIEMIQEGLTLAQMHDRLNGVISKPAICKRVKRLEKRLQPLPETYQHLTDKQQEFVSNVLAGDSQTTAALKAYDCKDRKSASVLATKLMKEPDINTSIADLLAQSGISKRQRIERLATHVYSNDNSCSMAALNLAAKLAGELTEKVDVNFVGVEQLRELIQLIPDKQAEAIDAEYTPM